MDNAEFQEKLQSVYEDNDYFLDEFIEKFHKIFESYSS